MSWEVMRGLRRVLAEASQDPDVRVVVLAGAGDEAFCAGADLGKMTGADEPEAGILSVHEARGVLAEVFAALWQLGKPTVARVQGFAMAGGFGLALACDLVVASERARFGAPEVNVGSVALHDHRAPRPLHAAQAGPRADADRAQGRRRRGAAHGIRDQGRPSRRARRGRAELAATLAAKSPAVMKLGRDAFYAVWDMAAPEALAHLHAMLSLTAQTEDAAEGIAAFLEKRAPRWQGR